MFSRILYSFLLSVLALLVSALPVSALVAPTNFTGSFSNAGVVQFSWQDNSNDETGYAIGYRFTTTASYSSFVTTAANQTSYSTTLTGGWPGCSYIEFAIRAINATSSTSSPIVKFITPPYPVGSAECGGLMMPEVSSITEGTVGTLNVALLVPEANTNRAISPTSIANLVGLPDGLQLSPEGVFSGTFPSRRTATLTLDLVYNGVSYPVEGRLVMKRATPATFRAPPALASPVVSQAVGDRVVHLGKPLTLSGSNHFSDPDTSGAARIVTNVGSMDFAFYPGVAPITVANFLGYVNRGDYNNVLIHRVVPGFVVQGGGYKAESVTNSIARHPAILNEPEISNLRGTVSMAKTGNDPNSATSEFFISLADNSANLNNQNEGFAVFARVAGNGMAVADTMNGLPKIVNSYFSTEAHFPVTVAGVTSYSPETAVKITATSEISALSFSATNSQPTVCDVVINAGQILINPITPGRSDITITATDLDNRTVETTFAVTVPENFTTWAAARVVDSAQRSTNSDPDGDGFGNLLEYAFVTNPDVTNQGWPQIATSPQGLRFPTRTSVGHRLRYLVQRSVDLTNGSWQTIWDSSLNAPFSIVPRDDNSVIATVKTSEEGNSQAIQFLRVQVEEMPLP